MNRLTNHLTFMGGHSLESKCYNKLRDLEDLEEELGIDLITLFKVVKQEKVFFKYENTYGPCDIFYCLLRKCWVVQNTETTEIYYLKDYSKTWALTKEELE